MFKTLAPMGKSVLPAAAGQQHYAYDDIKLSQDVVLDFWGIESSESCIHQSNPCSRECAKAKHNPEKDQAWLLCLTTYEYEQRKCIEMLSYARTVAVSLVVQSCTGEWTAEIFQLCTM